MRFLFGLLQKQQKAKRDTIFRQNGTEFGYNRNYGEWMHKSKHTASVVARTSSRYLKREIDGSPAIKILKHVVTSVAPKTFSMTILKMKIHMQTLIGNFFGVRFASLEANVKKLDRVKEELARDKNFHRTMTHVRERQEEQEVDEANIIDKSVARETPTSSSSNQNWK